MVTHPSIWFIHLFIFASQLLFFLAFFMCTQDCNERAEWLLSPIRCAYRIATFCFYVYGFCIYPCKENVFCHFFFHGYKFKLSFLCALIHSSHATGGPWNSCQTQSAFVIATATSTLCLMSKCPCRKAACPRWIHSSSFQATLQKYERRKADDTEMLQSISHLLGVFRFCWFFYLFFLSYLRITLCVDIFDVRKGLQ